MDHHMELRVSSWTQEAEGSIQEALALRLMRSPTLGRGETRERNVPEAR